MAETTNIYILSLQGGRIYVGKSNDVKKRFEQHKVGNGSAWTSKHNPIEILKVIKNASPFDEDRYVKEYLMKYGIEDVRGGSYCSVELSDEQITSIQKEIRGATDKCGKCGRDNHFANKCYAKTDVDGNRLDDEEEESESESEIDVIKCFKCGRYGHYASRCYAKKHVKGYYLT